MKKKLLITYASFGSGHKTVAEYVYDYFKNNSCEYEIKLIDVMDYGNLIAKFNLWCFNLNFKFQNELAFTIGYEISDTKLITSTYKEITNLFFKSELKKDILEFNPDILISSHFFGSITMGILNRKHKTNTKIITIITDYDSHYFWLRNQKNEHAYIVSNEIVKNEMIKYGIEPNKIYPFGIPISDKFKKADKDKEKIKLKYNIKNNYPIFLFFGGGSMGATYTYNYFKKIVKLNLKINIIFVSGKNIKLQNKCNDYLKENNYKNVTVLGFTKDVSNLLNIASCVITKPGGLSVTEALEMKTPMILIPGNGGPEKYNAKFITENNFGIKVYTPRHLVKVVKKLVMNQNIIKKMHKNLKRYEKNKSIEKLFDLVEKMEVKSNLFVQILK